MKPLAWSADLEQAAANYASSCPTDHDPDNRKEGWGENLAWSASSRKADIQENKHYWNEAVTVRA